jgi:hypothetical protein
MPRSAGPATPQQATGDAHGAQDALKRQRAADEDLLQVLEKDIMDPFLRHRARDGGDQLILLWQTDICGW